MAGLHVMCHDTTSNHSVEHCDFCDAIFILTTDFALTAEVPDFTFRFNYLKISKNILLKNYLRTLKIFESYSLFSRPPPFIV
jgi:hypothetical protein